MGFVFNGIPAAEVTIDGQVTATSTPSTDLASGQTRIQKGGIISLTGGTIADLYNVTASKDLYITHIYLGGDDGGAFNVKIGDKADLTNSFTAPIIEDNVAIVRRTDNAGILLIFPVPLKITATLSVVSNANRTFIYSINGFEA